MCKLCWSGTREKCSGRIEVGQRNTNTLTEIINHLRTLINESLCLCVFLCECVSMKECEKRSKFILGQDDTYLLSESQNGIHF